MSVTNCTNADEQHAKFLEEIEQISLVATENHVVRDGLIVQFLSARAELSALNDLHFETIEGMELLKTTKSEISGNLSVVQAKISELQVRSSAAGSSLDQQQIDDLEKEKDTLRAEKDTQQIAITFTEHCLSRTYYQLQVLEKKIRYLLDEIQLYS